MIEIRARRLKTLLSKSIGLLGTSIPEVVYFTTHWGIHTFGMRYPIDVVILDKNNFVKALKENLKPNRFFFWSPIFQHVLELPLGYIKKHNLRLNSLIKLVKYDIV